MSKEYRTVGVALACLVLTACNQAAPPSRWDEAQRRSTGEAGSKTSPYDEDLAETPPAWSPDGAAPTTSPPASPSPKWSPRGAADATPADETPIDLAALEQGEPLHGSEFNRFFPAQGGGWDLVYKQEKEGFALASLQRAGEEMAMLSITDLRSNPSAAEKYQRPQRRIAGHPAVAIGSQGEGALVAGRFQVQVRSQSGQFTQRDRQAWIERFDLDGLSQLK